MNYAEMLKNAAWAVLTKQDIPGVQAVIDRLYPVLETWWLRAIENALRRGDLLLGREQITAASLPELDLLSGRTPDGRQRFEVEQLLVDAYMRVLEEAISSFAPAVARKVEQESNALLLFGAAFWNLPGASEVALGASLSSGSFEDLEALVAGRIGSRRPQVLSAVRGLVSNVVNGRPQEESRSSLAVLLGLESTKVWLTFVLDSWAYRWFNISAIDRAVKLGYRFFRVVNNPPLGPDSKTTPFCRFVHGQVLSLDEVNLHLRRYEAAVLRRDHAGMEAAWPLLTGEAANDRGPGAQARFAREFARLGLPPYHPRCRTIVMPIRRDSKF